MAKALTLHTRCPSHFYGNAAIHIPFLIFARSKSIKANVLTVPALAAEECWRGERMAPLALLIQLCFAWVYCLGAWNLDVLINTQECACEWIRTSSRRSVLGYRMIQKKVLLKQHARKSAIYIYCYNAFADESVMCFIFSTIRLSINRAF